MTMNGWLLQAEHYTHLETSQQVTSTQVTLKSQRSVNLSLLREASIVKTNQRLLLWPENKRNYVILNLYLGEFDVPWQKQQNKL